MSLVVKIIDISLKVHWQTKIKYKALKIILKGEGNWVRKNFKLNLEQ